MGTLKAGAGTGTIQFAEELFPLQGFCGIHDDPHMRILYLESNEPFVIAAYEMVMLPDEVIDHCREMIAEAFRMPKDHVWLHMTHAITTPHEPGGPLIGPGGVVLEKSAEELIAETNRKKLFDQAVYDATKEALGSAVNIRPAKIRVGTGNSCVNCNRDIASDAGWWIGINPQGPSNKTMTVICVTGEDDAPVAYVVSYGIKPCAVDNCGMQRNERLISPDVPGKACMDAETILGAPVLFIMPAAGDQIPAKMALYDVIRDGKVCTVDLGVKEGFSFVEELGTQMGKDIVMIVKSAGQAEADPTIVLKETAFPWEGKQRTAMKLCKEAGWAPAGTAHVKVSTARVGNLAFVGYQPEINVQTEKELKEAIPFPHVIPVSMLNGGMKYMPDQAGYDHISWEAQSSPLMPGAAEQFVRTAGDLIRNSINNDQ